MRKLILLSLILLAGCEQQQQPQPIRRTVDVKVDRGRVDVKIKRE